jgi:O-antigen/teichoic acid export membrane protein
MARLRFDVLANLLGQGWAVLISLLPHTPEPVRFDRATLSRVWRFSGAAAGIGITGALLTHADRLVASRLLTLEQFGYYGLATTIGRSLYLLIAPVFSAVFPRLSGLAAARDTALIATLYSSSSQLMAFAIAAPAAVIFWMSFEAAFAWLGDAQAAAQIAPLAAMLVLGSALNGAMNQPYALQLANGLAYIGLRLNLLLVAVALPSAWALGSAYGAVGVASTWLVINGVYFVVGVPVTHRVTRIGRPVRWAFGDMLPAFAAAGAGAGLCHLAFGPASTRAGAVVLLAVGLAVGYACALAATPSVRIEMLALARRGWQSLRPGQ